MDTLFGLGSAPDRLAIRHSDGDVAHRGVSLGAVPVALTRLDVGDVTDLDLQSLGCRGDPSAAMGYDQDLIAIVNMPASITPLAEVHDAAVVIRRLAGLDDGLAGAMHGARISVRRFGRAWRGEYGDILQRNNLHDTLS